MLGEKHPDTLSSLYNLALSYAYNANQSKALELFEKVYLQRTEALGENSSDTLESMNALSNMYDAIGEHGKAEELRLKKKRIEGGK